MTKTAPGSIVEIDLPSGDLSYAQFTHHRKGWGAVLRVYFDVFRARPDRLAPLMQKNPDLVVLFPLGAAIKKGSVRVVGAMPLKAEHLAFPTFRDRVRNPKDNTYGPWWLWDGEREWIVKGLSPREERYPFRRLVNLEMLHHMILTKQASLPGD